MGHSYTVFFFLKGGLIVDLAALKKGAIRVAHPYQVIYRELPPPSPPPEGLNELELASVFMLKSGIFYDTVHQHEKKY